MYVQHILQHCVRCWQSGLARLPAGLSVWAFDIRMGPNEMAHPHNACDGSHPEFTPSSPSRYQSCRVGYARQAQLLVPPRGCWPDVHGERAVNERGRYPFLRRRRKVQASFADWRKHCWRYSICNASRTCKPFFSLFKCHSSIISPEVLLYCVSTRWREPLQMTFRKKEHGKITSRSATTSQLMRLWAGWTITRVLQRSVCMKWLSGG